jgi:hypothetical protein
MFYEKNKNLPFLGGTLGMAAASYLTK